MFRELDKSIAVAPQLTVEQVAAAKAQGFTRIVNNRPDGEDPGAPQGDAIAAAARAAGMDYVAIPVGHGGIAQPQVAAMAAALRDGRTLAYCRSGTRSTHLWALTRASMGGNPGDLVDQAAAAGYDIAAMQPTLAMLAGARH